MQKLYLSSADRRMVHGNTNYCEISRFIKEIPAEHLERDDQVKQTGFNSLGGVHMPQKSITNVGYGRPRFFQMTMQRIIHIRRRPVIRLQIRALVRHFLWEMLLHRQMIATRLVTL